MLTICTYPVIPVRSAPSECVEMVTQILFGEAYDVLRVDGRWAEILTCDDNYSGWIDYKLIGNLSEDEVNRWLSAKPVVVPPPFLRVRRDDDPALTLLTPGSLSEAQSSVKASCPPSTALLRLVVMPMASTPTLSLNVVN